MQLDLVTQLQELEEHRQRRRSAGPGRGARIAQHLAEVTVRVSGLHLPQWPTEPIADQLEMVDVVTDRAVHQPGRRPRQDEPGQHVGLEIVEFTLAHRSPLLPQIVHDRQSQPTPP